MHKILTNNLYILIFQIITSKNYLLSIADENICETCKNYKWIIHVTLNNNTISRCLECLDKSNIICKQQNV